MTNKDALEQMSQVVCASLDWWRHTDVTIRHDHEHALGALTGLVRERDVDTARTWNLRSLPSINPSEPSTENINKWLISREP